MKFEMNWEMNAEESNELDKLLNEEVGTMKVNGYYVRIRNIVRCNMAGRWYVEELSVQLYVEENDNYTELFSCKSLDQIKEENVAIAIEDFYRRYNEE